MNKLTLASLLLSLFLFNGMQSVRCSQENDGKNSLLMKRHTLPTCQLKSAIKDAILNIKDEVKELQSAMKEIAGLLKPKKARKNCADVYETGVRENGVYEVDPDGFGSFKVLCDMKTSGGGWTVFQRRLDGSVDFFRGWKDYKNGFGNLNGEFWLGLDKIHRLTNRLRVKLRIDMEDTTWNTRYAEYDHFAITGEKLKYKLNVGTYTGTAGDSFSRHSGSKFSTKDNDNDTYSSNCASMFKGGWWYYTCHRANLNGIYHHGTHSSYADGVNWYTWKGYNYSLKSTSMKIRPRQFGLKK